MRVPLTLCLAWLIGGNSVGQSTMRAPARGSVLLTPCEFHGAVRGEQGLIVVPENRSDGNSRAIAVHFFRFPATESSSLPPVFFLPGGPGGSYDEAVIARLARLPRDQISTLTELRLYNQRRDVFIVNHRGNADAPGLQSKSLRWFAAPGRLDTATTIEASSRREATGAKAAFDLWKARGMDLAGYDIINMVEDIDDIRKTFGHDKIALRGTSFGSQWSLAYMKQHPEHVDRALLAGVEPLDHGYDSPEGIWNVFKRLEQQVIAEGKIQLPSVGLLGAVKETVERLEKEPVLVQGRHPRRGTRTEVPIGIDDFRKYLLSGFKGHHRMDRAARQVWPKFVLEVYQEDYQYLASQIMAYRDDPSRRTMIATLVDNSLGITAAREKRLRAEPAYRWLGDVNWTYVATRDLTPTPVVSDDFRALTKSDSPVLMVQGDLDISTPIENALELIEYLPNGHLIRINGGTHGAIREVMKADSSFIKHLVRFMDADFDRADAKTIFKELPQSVSLAPLRFESLDGPSLWQQVDKNR